MGVGGGVDDVTAGIPTPLKGRFEAWSLARGLGRRHVGEGETWAELMISGADLDQQHGISK